MLSRSGKQPRRLTLIIKLYKSSGNESTSTESALAPGELRVQSEAMQVRKGAHFMTKL